MCQCLKRTVIDCHSVKSGKTKSCGCLAIETTVERSMRHGHAENSRQSGAYKSWSCMKRRCTTPHDEHWQWYGGRGISVCDRWMNSFEAFLKDMGERPEMATLDRIDANGNYEVQNCRWATNTEQQRNRRNNRILTAFGKSMCVSEWANYTGILKSTIKERLKRGWPVEEVLAKPVRQKVASTRQ